MQADPKQLVSAQLTKTLTSYYTSPEYKRTVISKVTLANVGNAAERVEIHVAGRKMLTNHTLDKDESWPAYMIQGEIMKPGDKLEAKTEGNEPINIMVSGVQVY